MPWLNKSKVWLMLCAREQKASECKLAYIYTYIHVNMI